MKTIRQLADEIGVSRQSVYNVVKKYNLQSKVYKDSQTGKSYLQLDEEQEMIVKSYFSKKPDNKELSSSQSQSFTVDSQIFDSILHELDSKNRQIEAMQKTIDSLTAQLAEISSMLKAEQILHAQSQQRIEQKEEAEEKKKRWFEFWK